MVMIKLLFIVLLVVISRVTFAAEFVSPFFVDRMHSGQMFIARDMTNEVLKARLLKQYSAWKGTRYHRGGSSHRGVDCSALMQHLFSESADLSLPRTAAEQMQRGKAVSRGELKPGDLVFFKTGRNQRHVGVFIGGDEFIHASTRQGVTISSLSNEYWGAHYQAARRVAVKAVG